MLATVHRRSTFEALRRPQRRIRSGPLSVAFVSREKLDAEGKGAGMPAEPVPQFAFSVPRRVGRAVVRNRLRRRLREQVARRQAGLRPGAYLISVGPGSERLAWDELGGLVERALQEFREK